jgi:hypothetical protein
MKPDNRWDLGTGGGQQRLLFQTAGVTTTYEQAHKETLNTSSDMLERCSKLQTLATRLRLFFASTFSIRTTRPRSHQCTVFIPGPQLASTVGRLRLMKEMRFPSFLGARCSKHFHPRKDNSSAKVIPVSLSTAQECVDRFNLQATIANESREALPSYIYDR